MPDRYLEVNSTLSGITSEIILNQGLVFVDTPLLFSVAKTDFSDILLVFEFNANYLKDINVYFEVVATSSYNYQDIGILFQVTLGADDKDIPFVFSVIRQPQTFMSYIFQKLYCSSSELAPMQGDIQLQDWNVKPNQIWFVQIVNDLVTLFSTLVDLEAGTNPIASGLVDATTLEVVLEYVDEYNVMEYYYDDWLCHLTLSAIPTGTRLFKVKPLTDMSEIRHAIYNNSNITISRGQAELDLHTYSTNGREVVLGTHIPELECGDVVDLTSTRRNKTAEKSQVLSQTISGSVGDSGETFLLNTLSVATYTELFRQ